jgi:hypothetical protein
MEWMKLDGKLGVYTNMAPQGVHLTVKEKIAALRLLKDCDEAKFALLEKGPSLLNAKGMEEKLENIQNIKISH